MRIRTDHAEAAAEKLLREFSVIDAPVPLAEMVRSQGLKLLKGHIPDPSVAGYIDLRRNEIVVSDSDGRGRQNFTVAHELGHFLLHRHLLEANPDLGIMHRRPIGGESDPKEREANAFAACLLVPDSLLAKYYVYQPANQVARIFGVSEEVIRYRLKETGRA